MLWSPLNGRRLSSFSDRRLGCLPTGKKVSLADSDRRQEPPNCLARQGRLGKVPWADARFSEIFELSSRMEARKLGDVCGRGATEESLCAASRPDEHLAGNSADRLDRRFNLGQRFV